MTRQNVTYGQPLESEIGFSRGVRIGNTIAISGTAPISPDGSTSSVGDDYGQTKRCIEIISEVLSRADATLSDVIRTRILLKNIDDWKAAAKAHGEFFAEIKPACTFSEVKGFINPDWLIEIEADAIVE